MMVNRLRVASPCKDCPNRYVGCHSTCVKYIDYQQKAAVEREEIKKKRTELYGEYTEYIVGRHNDRNRKIQRGQLR